MRPWALCINIERITDWPGGSLSPGKGEVPMFSEIQIPETPCIVIDAEIARQNVQAMQKAADECGCKLRPHTKTHKMGYFMEMQLANGCAGICCAKVSEAEVMAMRGAQDIFIAYPMVGAFRVRRAIELQKKVKRLILAVDSRDGALALEQAAKEAKCTLEVRLEIDTGARRTGASQNDYEALAKEISKMKHLKLTGIYTFKSLSLASGEATTDKEAAGAEEGRLMDEMAKRLRDAGVPIAEISAGSTPTGLSVAKTGLVTEIRPGTYIFGDYMLVKEGVISLPEIAVRMFVTVVSTPSPGYAVIDGGSKTFPMDITPDAPPYLYPGYAAVVGENGEVDENLKLLRLSEEHGMLSAKNGMTGLHVGQLLELIPIHVCPAVNLQNTVFVYDGGRLNRMAVEARGMLV